MKEIPIPRRLQERPRYKGLPIPYIATIKDNGDPDFRAVDEVKRREVMMIGVCQLCSEPLGKYFFFVGGPEAAEANQYFEPPIHLDCLLYAMQVCPFIVGRIDHADIAAVQKANPNVIVTTDETFANKRNPQWVIKKATQFTFGKTPGGTILMLPIGVLYQTEPLYPDKMNAEDWERVKQQLKDNK